MQDLKIEYRDGKLVELIVDGERQNPASLCELSLSHKAGSDCALSIGRVYHLGIDARAAVLAEVPAGPKSLKVEKHKVATALSQGYQPIVKSEADPDNPPKKP